MLNNFSYKAAAATVRAIEAGLIWNQADANLKCPQVAANNNSTWTGH